MTSVIRVKRKRDCEPAEALLLARKKLKSDFDPVTVSSDIADVIKIEEKVFHFAATVDPEIAHSQEVVADRVKEAIQVRTEQKELMRDGARKRKMPKFFPSPCSSLPKLKHLKDTTVAACQSVFRNKCLNLTSDVKHDSAQLSKSATKIEDCEQCILYHNDDHVPRLAKSKEDVDEIMCNNITMLREKLNVSDNRKKEYDYVYDLYYCRKTNANWDMSELLYVQPYKYTDEDLLNYSESDEEIYEDEDDSNDEGNWRNDYPDDDDDDSSKSSSSSDDDLERFIEQEEEEEEEDEDNPNEDDDDDALMGMDDTAAMNYNEDIEVEAFDDYDPGDNGDNGGGGDDNY